MLEIGRSKQKYQSMSHFMYCLMSTFMFNFIMGVFNGIFTYLSFSFDFGSSGPPKSLADDELVYQFIYF